jgi:hypothetical protein
MTKVKVIPKAIRHSIYVKALDVYQTQMKLSILARDSVIMSNGLCFAINVAIKSHQLVPFVKDNMMMDRFYINDTYNPYINKSIHLYPELIKHIPEHWSVNGYWYLINDTDIRIAILKDAIECSKPSKHVKPYKVIQL